MGNITAPQRWIIASKVVASRRQSAGAQQGNLVGGVLEFQMVSVQPGINLLGLATTNNIEVFLGIYATPYRGYQGHFHHLDSSASVASASAPAVLTMRFN